MGKTFDQLRAELLAANARGDHKTQERVLRKTQALTYRIASTP